MILKERTALAMGILASRQLRNAIAKLARIAALDPP
jgi:hypothetical protein